MADALLFNDLLLKGQFDLAKVRFLRHMDARGRSIYELWRDDRPAFDLYQSFQGGAAHRTLRTATQWASFVGTPWGETMFVGLYRANHVGLNRSHVVSPTTGEILPAQTLEMYDLAPEEFLADFAGRLFVDWGLSKRTWIQRADLQQKPILEIRKAIVDPPFPGYLNFIENFSRISSLPQSWIELLRVAKGVYVLTCPKTKELYIGSAYGEHGFHGRWMEEARDGHGGNIQLRSRERSDFQVSILEVAGSALSDAQIIGLESHWKKKLQSREMGLNSN